MDKDKILNVFIDNYAKIIGIFLGLIFSVLVIWLGIFKTIFIGVCMYIGYFLGSKIDNKESILKILDQILPLRNFK